MKAILISDHQKWCALMMNGIKKTEVRKGTALYKAIQKLIDEYGFAEFYVYCTKGSHYLAKPKESEKYLLFTKGAIKLINEQSLNGKVLFKFRCYEVEEIKYDHDDRDEWYATKTLNDREIENQTCLSFEELDNYLKGNGSAIHISDLEIFDKPKELSEFKHCTEKTCIYGKCHKYMHCLKPLTKAPQSFMYIESEK